MDKYQLRYAAGMYWLLDMEQKGPKYKRPVCINESGAKFWKLISAGKGKEDIAAQLVKEYGLEFSEALNDVELFISNLRKQGIEI